MTPESEIRGAVIDSHVHIYDCFELSEFLLGAWNNFSAAARLYGFDQPLIRVLMLAETSRDHWFQKIAASIGEESTDTLPSAGTWRFDAVPGDPCAVLASGSRDEKLLLIAGRQIVTKDNIEILALGTREVVTDGLPLMDVVNSLRDQDALTVVPWGVGKWLGRRGRIVRELVANTQSSGLFLGDIIGRPAFWPRSRIFRNAEAAGFKVLPGTDPLPLESEAARAGECGVFVHGPIDMKQPTQALKRALRSNATQISPYIRREPLMRFLRNQVSIRR